jgi:hypothetical protein
MSNPPLGALLSHTFHGFELCGQPDQHQEQNARLKAGRSILTMTAAVARQSFHHAAPLD